MFPEADVEADANQDAYDTNKSGDAVTDVGARKRPLWGRGHGPSRSDRYSSEAKTGEGKKDDDYDDIATRHEALLEVG